jgi:hypothetical protein
MTTGPTLGAFNQGELPTIACFNKATVPFGIDLDAFNRGHAGIHRRTWGAGVGDACKAAKNHGLPKRAWAMVFLDDADQPDAWPATI